MCMGNARDARGRRSPLPRYLAAGRALSKSPIMAPKRSQTRHSHLVELRLVINTSNTAASRHPSCVPSRYNGQGVGSLLDSQM